MGQKKNENPKKRGAGGSRELGTVRWRSSSKHQKKYSIIHYQPESQTQGVSWLG